MLRFAIGIATILFGLALWIYGSFHDKFTFLENLKTFVASVGSVAVVTGLITFVMEWKATREYFGQRLADIVVKDDYLSQLSPEKIRALLMSAQKHLFANGDILREGGFLEYFDKKLHGYIAAPFRENVCTELVFRRNPISPTELIANDKVSYNCRMMGNEILSTVRIQPEKNEFLAWQKLTVFLSHAETGEKETYEIPNDDVLKLINENKPFVFQIPEKFQKDRLQVVIESEYAIRLTKLQCWQMAHPTKDLRISISYPPDLDIDALPLVQHPEIAVVTNQPGYFGLTYDSWMLPMSGIAWTFAARCNEENVVGDTSRQEQGRD